MSVLIKIKGITRLSELEIDADKDWQAKGITNLKQVAELMSKGDIVVRDTSILVRLPPGPEDYCLTSAGPGKIPSWQPKGGMLRYYYPVYIGSGHLESKPAIAQLVAKSAVPGSDRKYACGDSPPDNLRMLTPSILLAKSGEIATVNQSYEKNAPIGRDVSILVDGAVSETAVGAQTDETAAARDPTTGDMNLCPMTPAVDDKYYFGFDKQFRRIWLNTGMPGAGNWANVFEYWNGSSWVQVTDEEDHTSDFTKDGINRIDWVMPADWARTTILGMNLYWLRCRTITFVNQTVRPLGTQAWACLLA
jgi:hypothetical protein